MTAVVDTPPRYSSAPLALYEHTFVYSGDQMEAVAPLRQLASMVRPVSGAESRLMAVPELLSGLFAEGGIRRGTTVAVGPPAGGCALALSLAATVTAGRGWVAAVGLPALGLVAAAEAGVDLRRLALVPEPGEQWPAVVASLLDGFELLLLRPPARARGGDARRLAARARERGTVLLLVDAPWPEPADVTMRVEGGSWEGLGQGWGVLTGRRAQVVAGGRRVGGRDRRVEVWLPARGGGLARADAAATGAGATGAGETRTGETRADAAATGAAG